MFSVASSSNPASGAVVLFTLCTYNTTPMLPIIFKSGAFREGRGMGVGVAYFVAK